MPAAVWEGNEIFSRRRRLHTALACQVTCERRNATQLAQATRSPQSRPFHHPERRHGLAGPLVQAFHKQALIAFVGDWLVGVAQ